MRAVAAWIASHVHTPAAHATQRHLRQATAAATPSPPRLPAPPRPAPTCSAERSTLPGDTVPAASNEEVASRLRSVSLMPACGWVCGDCGTTAWPQAATALTSRRATRTATASALRYRQSRTCSSASATTCEPLAMVARILSRP